jgi:hypothetical protein
MKSPLIKKGGYAIVCFTLQGTAATAPCFYLRWFSLSHLAMFSLAIGYYFDEIIISFLFIL